MYCWVDYEPGKVKKEVYKPIFLRTTWTASMAKSEVFSLKFPSFQLIEFWWFSEETLDEVRSCYEYISQWPAYASFLKEYGRFAVCLNEC